MDVPVLASRLTAKEAVSRTDRITLSAYVMAKLRSALGRESEPEAVYPAYYPNYIAYTTVELHRLVRKNRTVRFLAGIDAITGRVGEVDVELPDRMTASVDPNTVLERQIDGEQARAEWRDWLFTYLDRTYRPVKRPDSSLDELELRYTPYWIVDHGSASDSYAVSGLTKQVELVEDIGPLTDHYEQSRDRQPNDSSMF